MSGHWADAAKKDENTYRKKNKLYLCSHLKKSRLFK